MKQAAGEVPVAWMDRMRIPKRHWQANLAAIPDKCDHKKMIVKWVDDVQENVRKARGMFLLGDCSTGKSACAAIMLKAAATQNIMGLWVRARELPKFMIDKTRFDEDSTVIDRAGRVPVLVIDEVLVRDRTGYSEEVIEMLVRQRIDDELSTILTTNHSKKVLTDNCAELMAALMEAAYPQVVSGHDFRKAIATELTKNGK